MPSPGCPRLDAGGLPALAAHPSPVVSYPEHEFGHAGIAAVPANSTSSPGTQDFWADRLHAPQGSLSAEPLGLGT